MKNNYEKKLFELDFLHDLGLRPTELKYATAKLEKVNADFKTEEEWLAALDSIVMTYRNNPLEIEAKKQSTAANQICPICKHSCEPISITAKKNAYYCKSHRVVLPMIADGQ